jgi:hypothetical protein
MRALNNEYRVNAKWRGRVSVSPHRLISETTMRVCNLVWGVYKFFEFVAANAAKECCTCYCVPLKASLKAQLSRYEPADAEPACHVQGHDKMDTVSTKQITVTGVSVTYK